MKNLILLLIIALILSGCISENRDISSKIINNEVSYSFTGSSESWEVLYEVDIINKKQGENQVDENGTATFIGEAKAPEILDYKLETERGMNSSSGTGVIMYDIAVSFTKTSCGNCIPIQDDEEIELEIIWDGQTENMTLTANN